MRTRAWNIEGDDRARIAVRIVDRFPKAAKAAVARVGHRPCAAAHLPRYRELGGIPTRVRRRRRHPFTVRHDGSNGNRERAITVGSSTPQIDLSLAVAGKIRRIVLEKFKDGASRIGGVDGSRDRRRGHRKDRMNHREILKSIGSGIGVACVVGRYPVAL